MNQIKERRIGRMVAVRVALIALMLAFGVIGLRGLMMLKEPPKAVDLPEPVLTVEVRAVQQEDVPVVITGYGQARALDTVSIAPEVPGRVLEVHARLETGEVVPRGELLFRIDPLDYRAQQEQAQALVTQAENALARMQTQYKEDQQRLATVRRSRELAQAEFERVKNLFEQDEVGTKSGVERAEMGFNEADDAFARLNQAVLMYPNMVQEAESALQAARSRLELAEANLSRTEVRAPFDARVKMVQLEAGQYVRPGEPVVVLADDSVLEISVPLDSRDARDWLAFEDAKADGQNWFGSVAPVDCVVRWTEDKQGHVWRGKLHRVESFDQTTRTVTVAVRVESGVQGEASGALPLVDGMFCEVEIPGLPMKSVVALPRWAVTYEGAVYLANTEDRLEVREVQVLRTQGEETYVAGGLVPGERVIVTRLQDPLPNTRLDVKVSGVAGDDTPARQMNAEKANGAGVLPAPEAAQ